MLLDIVVKLDQAPMEIPIHKLLLIMLLVIVLLLLERKEIPYVLLSSMLLVIATFPTMSTGSPLSLKRLIAVQKLVMLQFLTTLSLPPFAT